MFKSLSEWFKIYFSSLKASTKARKRLEDLKCHDGVWFVFLR